MSKLIDYKKIINNPIFFERNRVFRVYKGGMLFNDLFGDKKEDGNYPEEWIASRVKAINKVKSHDKEGVSKVKNEDVYFDDLLKNYRSEMIGDRTDFGLLIKALDSAIRLPIQAHPDKEFSNKYFSSDYGKAEMWIILETRPDAEMYFGFKNQISKEEFSKKVEESIENKDVMTDLLNVIEPKKGDTFFVPAKMIHAIGYGCLILEIQEPTDFTIQLEAWCGDYRLSDFEMYLDLEKDIALECIDFSMSGEKMFELATKHPKLSYNQDGIMIYKIIDKDDTPCFSVNKIVISEGNYTIKNAPSVYIVTDGQGEVTYDGNSTNIKKGDYFFAPHIINNKCTITSTDGIDIIECLPPEK